MLPCMGVWVFTIQKQPCKCHNCRRFLRILANFTSGQSHPWVIINNHGKYWPNTGYVRKLMSINVLKRFWFNSEIYYRVIFNYIVEYFFVTNCM